MKKFYIPILVLSLLTSLMTQAQVTYNSITSNPSNFTLDDPRFWGGTTLADVPPNPCTLCTIKINSDVFVVPFNGQIGGLGGNGGVGTSSQLPGANAPGLSHITLINSTVNLFGTTTLTINSYLTLTNSSITLGNNPTSVESIFVNDQVDVDATSSIQLANDKTLVNTNNDGGKSIIGPHADFGHPGSKSAGLFSIPGGTVDGFTYTMILTGLGYGTGAGTITTFNQNGYTLNCNGASPNTCALGIVFGPAITSATANPTFGVTFMPSTTLPVDLVQFLALKNGDGSVKLVWATSQEVNAGYYDIERSGDQSSWTKVGTVKAVGNTSTTSNYSFVDRLPVDGTGYYRLKMVDLDGKFKYSKTVTVTVENDTRPLVIYNNPFSDMIRMKVNVSRGQTLIITVSDMLGKTYINQNYHAQTGDNLINLPSSISDHGVYVMRVYGESYDQTVKLQKQ